MNIEFYTRKDLLEFIYMYINRYITNRFVMYDRDSDSIRIHENGRVIEYYYSGKQQIRVVKSSQAVIVYCPFADLRDLRQASIAIRVQELEGGGFRIYTTDTYCVCVKDKQISLPTDVIEAINAEYKSADVKSSEYYKKIVAFSYLKDKCTELETMINRTEKN